MQHQFAVMRDRKNSGFEQRACKPIVSYALSYLKMETILTPINGPYDKYHGIYLKLQVLWGLNKFPLFEKWSIHLENFAE